MSVADWISIAVTVALTVAGLWLANSLSRKARAELQLAAVRRRFEVYPELWTATKGAAPMAEVIGDQSLTQENRNDLYDTLTTWFWDKGGGMLLGEPSRTIYLRAKENLKLPPEKIWPQTVAEKISAAVDQELARSQLARRQLSLLRTAMRADLGIVGRPYGGLLTTEDKDFLRAAGARLWQRPWWDGSPRTWVAERLRQ